MKLALRSLLSVPCLIAFLMVGEAAHADTFTFLASGSYWSGSGIITAVADPTISTAYDVTSITGTVDGFTITGLYPCATYDPSDPCNSTGPGIAHDNLLYIKQLQAVDFHGIGILLGTSGLEATIAADGTHTDVLYLDVEHQNTLPIGFSVTAVPEPGSFLLLGSGLLGVAGGVRRRLMS